MFRYQISKLSKLGDYDQKYGQTYWVEIASDLTPVKFNSQNQHIGVGDVITAEEKVMKKSTKGTEYWQLKKVRVEEGDSQEPVTQPHNGSETQLDRIESKLDKLLGLDIELSKEAIAKNLDEVDLSEPDRDGQDDDLGDSMPEDFLSGE